MFDDACGGRGEEMTMKMRERESGMEIKSRGNRMWGSQDMLRNVGRRRGAEK